MSGTLLIAPPHAPARLRVPAAAVAFAAIVAIAFVLRAGTFGNPLAGLDEQFYLLVGDRMWSGALPYVDLWDRKPIGLFALFAAIRLLPGDGVVAAQVVATIFAAVTAAGVALLARRQVGWVPAVMAAAFYLAALNQLWGETSQTPVFYNALIVAAALLTLAQDRRAHLLAMLAAGCAVQIKTNAVFEGAWFGLWLVAAEWRATRSAGATARRALLLAGIGALPTLVAIGVYWHLGQFDAWWQANVASVLAKGAVRDTAAAAMLAQTIILFAPVVLLALLGLWRRTARFTTWRGIGFEAGWIAFALADFVAIGGYFPHYALPLLLACMPLAANAFAIPRLGTALFALAMAWPMTQAILVAPRVTAAERGYAAQVLAALPPEVRQRCLFVYEGPVAYIHLSHACTATRYAFSAHLSSGREAPSLGEDAGAALDAAMARHPAAVLTVAHSTWTDRNPANERRLAGWLRRDYVLAARLPHKSYAPDERLLVWRYRKL